jgi:hypothetical protein
MEQKPQGQENCQLGRSEQTTGFPPEKVKKGIPAGLQGSVATNLFDSRFVDTDRSEAVLNLLGIEYSHRRCVHQVGVDL